jgi:hypothetical protein
VAGEDVVFKVTASVEDCIANVKKLIYQVGKHGAFCNADALEGKYVVKVPVNAAVHGFCVAS